MQAPKQLKKILLFSMLTIVLGIVMLLIPIAFVSAGEPTGEPVCDGSTWYSNGSGSTITVPAGCTITKIKIKAGNDKSGEITANGNYGHFVKVEAPGDPEGNGCSNLVYNGMFVLNGTPAAGYEWFGYYGVSGIGTGTVTVSTNHMTGQADCVIQNVSHLEYICTCSGTTTTDPGTTTTDPGTTTTLPGTTTTLPGTTTTLPGTTTTTPTTGPTTTTPTTTVTTPTTTPTTPTTGVAAAGTIAVLALTGYSSLWYIVGSILVALGIVCGSMYLSVSLRRR